MSPTSSAIPPAVVKSESLFLHTEGGEPRIDILDYWRTLTKHKWAIGGFAAAITLLTAVVVMVMTPVYRATTTILIEPNKQKVVSSIEDVYNGFGASREYYQTQVEILKSHEVALKAVAKLKLYDHPDYDPRQPKKGLAALLEQVGFATSEPPAEWNEETLAAATVTKFESSLTITPIRLSQLVDISFESRDAAFAARAANVLAEAYIENDLDARYQMTKQASVWLQGRLSSLKDKLTQSEEALQVYREKQGIADIKGSTQGGAGEGISQLTMQLTSARARRAEAENAYKLIKRATEDGSLGSLPAVQRSQIVAEAKRQEAEADRKMSDISQRYGHSHPKYVAAEGELNTARDNVRRQIDVVVAGVTQEFEAARGTERALEQTLGSARGSVVVLNRKEFNLTVLEREVDSNRQMYDMFIKRAKETNVAGDLQSTVARVVDAAVTPKQPIKPKKSITVAVALFLGLLIGSAIALLLEMLDNTFKTTEDIETRLKQPLLTVLPKLEKGEMDRTISGTQILAKPNSLYSEAIRTARTGVLLSSVDIAKRTLLVTSSIPGEGKTTFSVNLALAHANTKKTLLVDADMRRPSVGKAFGFEPSAKGLSDLVAGTAKLSECVHRVKDSTLTILASGPIPPNPLELLHSDKFRQTIAMLQEHFDIVIIDSPPVELVSDALVIADQATGVLFVVRAMSTPYPLARKAIQRIRRANGHIMGVVLNALDFNKAEKYYGEYSGYGKKYGANDYHGGYGTSYGAIPASPDLKA
jgi:exopolysaccharide transport family protein